MSRRLFGFAVSLVAGLGCAAPNTEGAASEASAAHLPASAKAAATVEACANGPALRELFEQVTAGKAEREDGSHGEVAWYLSADEQARLGSLLGVGTASSGGCRDGSAGETAQSPCNTGTEPASGKDIWVASKAEYDGRKESIYWLISNADERQEFTLYRDRLAHRSGPSQDPEALSWSFCSLNSTAVE